MKTKRFIRIRDTDVYYEKRGRGIPMLILHGWSVDHALMSGSMEGVFKGANRDFARIYVDLPGMGKSSVNDAIRTADDVLAVLLEFIDRVIPDERFLLVGESWGGALCRGILHRRKESVIGLCLLCPVSVSGAKKIDKPGRVVLERDESLIASLPDQERTFFESISVLQTRRCWKRFKRDVYPALANRNVDYLGHILHGEYTEDIFSKPLGFDRPVLLLLGRQDSSVGYRDQSEYFMDFPRATVAILDGAGHNLQIEREAVFQSLLADWLDRVRMNSRARIATHA